MTYKYFNKKSRNDGTVYSFNKRNNTVTLTPINSTKAKSVKMTFQDWLRATTQGFYKPENL